MRVKCKKRQPIGLAFWFAIRLFTHDLKYDFAVTIAGVALDQSQILPRADGNASVDKRNRDERAEQC